jgi:hypothetical protein
MPRAKGLAKPEAWWSAVQAAVRVRATTAELWGVIRDYGAQQGISYPPNMFAEVNRLRSLAGGLRGASERLGRASGSDAITSAMLAPTIYARAPNQRSASPLFHVRFEMTTRVGDQLQSGWYNMEYTGSLPGTVGQLMEDVSDIAQGLSTSYAVALVELGAVEIGEW